MLRALVRRSYNRNVPERQHRHEAQASARPAGRMNLTTMDSVKKLFIWMAVAGLIVLAVLLPVLMVTGMFGGQPLAGTIALVGLILLAFGVAWYGRTRRARF